MYTDSNMSKGEGQIALVLVAPWVPPQGVATEFETFSYSSFTFIYAGRWISANRTLLVTLVCP